MIYLFHAVSLSCLYLPPEPQPPFSLWFPVRMFLDNRKERREEWDLEKL
jgi:hypothetical protein